MDHIDLSVYDEPVRELKLETSIYSKIDNRQFITLLSGDDRMSRGFERDFDSSFQSLPNPIYNCHGMTFASRRTGIYDTPILLTILKDEYTHVKKEEEVLTGDIIVYFTHDERDILHSGIVTYVEKISGYPSIKILSKAGKLGEIIHHPQKVPEVYKGLIKYYRIGHKIKLRRAS